MRVIFSMLLLVYAQAIIAEQVLDILRDDAAGYAQVVRGVELELPRDFSAHEDYRTEWWYLTANLSDAEGRQWGLQWTLFRQALSPLPSPQGWQNNQFWMAHAALTTPRGHSYEQRYARGGIGQAGVSVIAVDGHFSAWMDDWEWRSEVASILPATLNFSVNNQSVRLLLESKGGIMLQGDNGYSQKSAQGQASYYYSYPQIKVSAEIKDEAKTHTLEGVAWLDREWSSQALAPNQQGWDWFSLHLKNGQKLMLYRLRHEDGDHWKSGGWIDRNGNMQTLQANDIEMSVTQSRSIKTAPGVTRLLPLEWRLELPGRLAPLRVKPLYDDQWMGTSIPYWEGVVLVNFETGESAGVGYMELTGYD